MSITTFKPDAHPEISSVDGYVWRYALAQTWAQIHNGVGTNADDTDGAISAEIAADASSKWKGIYRPIITFSTLALSGLTVVSAYLKLYCHEKSVVGAAFAAANNFAWNIFGATPVSHTALATSDFANCGVTAFSTAKTYANITVNAWNQWNLNASGIATITSDITKFSIRESNFDVADVEPAWQFSTDNAYVRFRTRDYGDGSFAPQLVVTATSSTNTLNRVTSIVDYFSSGWGNRPPSYKMELSLGGLSSIYASPMPDREPPPTVPLPSLPFRKFTPDQYAQWLNTHSLEQIIGIFGKWPTFTEWSSWYATYGGTTQLW